jgi:hypothetical protein
VFFDGDGGCESYEGEDGCEDGELHVEIVTERKNKW